MLCYSIKKYIGSYSAVMGGVDAIIFTGGIGENDELVRAEVMRDMEYLGIDFDFEKNNTTIAYIDRYIKPIVKIMVDEEIEYGGILIDEKEDVNEYKG